MRALGRILVVVLLGNGVAFADAASERRTRCATRLAVSILGQSPDATLLNASSPQDQVDTLLGKPAFVERFARFINATFNDDRGLTPQEDAAYWLAKEILTTGKPWSDLFAGKYNVDIPTGGTTVAVTADPNGLGYFRSLPWLKRYAGNEEQGYKLSTAYRMVNNILGVKLIPNTNAPGADISATGRMAQPCAGCHYQGPFALDLIARVLTRKKVVSGNITFTAPTDGPQQVLDTTITNDADVVQTAIGSDMFKFRACRLAFLYLYGRAENQCEAAVFDQCIDAFSQSGTIQSALAAVAKNPGFCQ